VQLSFSEEELIAHLDDELNVSIRQSIAVAPAMPALPPKKPQNFTRRIEPKADHALEIT